MVRLLLLVQEGPEGEATCIFVWSNLQQELAKAHEAVGELRKLEEAYSCLARRSNFWCAAFQQSRHRAEAAAALAAAQADVQQRAADTAMAELLAELEEEDAGKKARPKRRPRLPGGGSRQQPSGRRRRRRQLQHSAPRR